MDYCFFIPLTPNPGTQVYEEAIQQGIIQVADRRAYNFHTPIMRTKRFSAKELENLYFKLMFSINISRIVAHVRWFLGVKNKRCRRVHKSLLKYGIQITLKYVINRVCHPFSNRPMIYSRKPAWYDL
jgi:hypothetical protein